jgi:predicted alpha-1,2-mannosidase
MITKCTTVNPIINMKKVYLGSVLLLSVLTVFLFQACSKPQPKEPYDYINPFIGTGGHGHTYPGATAPFGMVQLSPDTRKDSWDGCSGYHYSDSVIFGFSHTHLSGTGVGDYGDIRFMPMVGAVKTNPGTSQFPDSGYASTFSHDMEMAKAGYYAVHLNDYDIYVGLTTTERAGFHKYLFPKTDEAHIVIDLKESVVTEEILSSEIKIENDYAISGLRRSSGWANDQYVYFYAEFSEPFKAFGIVEDGVPRPGEKSAKGKNLKAWFDFSTDARTVILVKVGISAVDASGAKNNLLAEIPSWNFDSVKRVTQSKWIKQLEKIQIEGGSDVQKEVFYTALYHTMLAPNLYTDVDGRYRGHNLRKHKSKGFNMYTVFSLWDTFRALHPLFTIVERERTNDFILSMLDMYKKGGLLPVWELAANETNCMIGYHAVPVIVDAYVKGINDFDAKLALQAMQASANANQFGLNEYKKKGYIPADKEGESVSKTLEYAYDDWCISEMARLLKQDEIQKAFIERAQYYKNIYNKETGFFRGKANGCFVTPFNPTEVNFMLTEANTWQYNFFVPQDINTHIEMMGGDEAYEKKLDDLFSSDEMLTGRHQSDITGLIGQYAHGNEPSHHMAYLYNYIGKPWKTQQLVRRIMDELYTNKPDGLSGNEDCGQMSAWYVMSAMGFYPVTPGSNKYVVGTPLFESMNIALENGKQFKIVAKNVSESNIYVHAIKYNNEPWTKSYITHDMIMNGGVLEFTMAKEPKKSWGLVPDNRPVQKITEHLIVPAPYFKAASKTFTEKIDVEIDNLMDGAEILWGYKTDTDEPDMKNLGEAIELTQTAELVSFASMDGKNSLMEKAAFVKIPEGRSVNIKNQYSLQYTAGGDIALVNTLRGGSDFKTGNWQGYWGVDLDATIDLGKEITIRRIGAGFLQDQNSWIFMPEWVEFEISTDGLKYKKLKRIENNVDEKQDGGIVRDFEIRVPRQKVRFIKVYAKNKGFCPDWHKGAGEPAWIFVDEVWVK